MASTLPCTRKETQGKRLSFSSVRSRVHINTTKISLSQLRQKVGHYQEKFLTHPLFCQLEQKSSTRMMNQKDMKEGRNLIPKTKMANMLWRVTQKHWKNRVMQSGNHLLERQKQSHQHQKREKVKFKMTFTNMDPWQGVFLCRDIETKADSWDFLATC